ncbi:MAG TPA: hypothetical protein VN677_02730 [Gemmatimonadaceae bacterium]|nr:hypothetical protein [Gemmatimonadaceae bacterium]
MINRLKDYFEDPREPENQDDFFEIETPYDYFAVSRETAMEIERRLAQLPPPRWVAFRDLAGAVHRVIAAHIYRISECTMEQRSARRAFFRARRQEDKADRRPGEDDD